MPATSVHFNGGVNLADTETVMREIAARVPFGVRRIPDGEVGGDPTKPTPGARSYWVWFLIPAFHAAAGVKETQPDVLWGDEFPRFALDGDPATVQFGTLGYVDAYLESYRTFLRLRNEGVLSADQRFQVQLPTPRAGIFWMRAEDQAAVFPIYERAVFKEASDFLDQVDYDDVAVQWDVCMEIGQLEGWFGPKESAESVAEELARCLDVLPNEVPTGVHLCYGDYRHHHISEPDSLATQVDLVNAVSAIAQHPLSFAAFTVPQYQTNPEFFRPLQNLRPHDQTELYFGLVPYHPDQQEPGTTDTQLSLIEANVPASVAEYGICTECGMARADQKEVTQLLDLHREIVSTPG